MEQYTPLFSDGPNLSRHREARHPTGQPCRPVPRLLRGEPEPAGEPQVQAHRLPASQHQNLHQEREARDDIVAVKFAGRYYRQGV